MVYENFLICKVKLLLIIMVEHTSQRLRYEQRYTLSPQYSYTYSGTYIPMFARYQLGGIVLKRGSIYAIPLTYPAYKVVLILTIDFNKIILLINSFNGELSWKSR